VVFLPSVSLVSGPAAFALLQFEICLSGLGADVARSFHLDSGVVRVGYASPLDVDDDSEGD